jgi:predicted aspartyl protease
MRSVAIFAGLLLAIGAFGARFAERAMPDRSDTQVLAAAPAAPAYPRSLTIPRDDRGQFTVEARVNGRRL